MPKADWRSPDAYEEWRSLDAPGFAYEFLARSDEFQRERRKLDRDAERNRLDPVDADAFARRWGLRFRASVRQRHRCTRRALDPCGAPDGHPAHRPSA